jgi:hypothetical protein
MDEIFLKAKTAAEELVTLFAKLRLPDDLVEQEAIVEDSDYDSETQSIILLSPSRQRDLRDRLKKDADAIYLDSKRGAVTSLSEVPRGMWLLLLAFGFNEIYAFVSFIFSNPAVLFLLLLLAVSVVFLYQSGLLLPLARAAWASVGPATRVVLASAGPVMETIFTAAAEFLQQLSDKMRPEDARQQQQDDTSSTSSSPQTIRSKTPADPVFNSTPASATPRANKPAATEQLLPALLNLTPFGTPVKKRK